MQLRSITFSGPGKKASINFASGVNVVCGASDTGKSFLAEAIDFMLGGSTLKDIPERDGYDTCEFSMQFSDGTAYQITRSLSGGNFCARTKGDDQIPNAEQILKQRHAEGKDDNMSGFLLSHIGLLNKRLLRSKSNGTTQSLSFRDLARLVVIQEGEIQKPASPFLTGQFTTKTSELSTLKLILTGVDDSAIVPTQEEQPDVRKQLALIDEMIVEIQIEIDDPNIEQAEVSAQFSLLEDLIEAHKVGLEAAQEELSTKIGDRKILYNESAEIQNRQIEIKELLSRFDLLKNHYRVDQDRLTAIQESGSLLLHTTETPCPLCGASPEADHSEHKVDADVELTILAAGSELEKINLLIRDLENTIVELQNEEHILTTRLVTVKAGYSHLDDEIRASISPAFVGARAQFVDAVEKKAKVEAVMDRFDRLEKLEEKKQLILESIAPAANEALQIESGLSPSIAHAFSMRVERILRAWNFPGECRVHFDNQKSDFVIDGKPRGSRGKGLRAITHAAVTLALLEYCKDHSLPHPGFIVLDSPLLAYFKPEGEDDVILQGTDLKERFYDYLTNQHGRDSQIIIIENEHPPADATNNLRLTVFTGNPSEGRYGLL